MEETKGFTINQHDDDNKQLAMNELDTKKPVHKTCTGQSVNFHYLC
ncbi:hypothetical protein [Echinicola soli]|nr:hypothetical protein [Echinicola soli]